MFAEKYYAGLPADIKSVESLLRAQMPDAVRAGLVRELDALRRMHDALNGRTVERGPADFRTDEQQQIARELHDSLVRENIADDLRTSIESALAAMQQLHNTEESYRHRAPTSEQRRMMKRFGIQFDEKTTREEANKKIRLALESKNG